jgi:hypothetical protein
MMKSRTGFAAGAVFLSAALAGRVVLVEKSRLFSRLFLTLFSSGVINFGSNVPREKVNLRIDINRQLSHVGFGQ